MRKKEFAKVTISEVAEAANLNRKTFYYHFKDMHDLLSWTLQDEALSLISKYDLQKDHRSAVKFILDYLEDNNEFIDNILNSYARLEVREFLYVAMRDQLLGVINKICKEESIDLEEDYRTFVAGFCTEAFVGMIVHWRDNADRIPRERLEGYLDRIFIASIKNLSLEASKY